MAKAKEDTTKREVKMTREELEIRKAEIRIQEKALGINAISETLTMEQLTEKYKDFIEESNKEGTEEFHVPAIPDKTTPGSIGEVTINELSFPYTIGTMNKLIETDTVYKIGFRKYPQQVVDMIKSTCGVYIGEFDESTIMYRHEVDAAQMRNKLKEAGQGVYYSKSN